MTKKTLIAVAAVLSLAAGAASAQQASSVTLYGIMDVNIAQSKTFGSATTPSTTVTGMNVYNPTNPRGSRFGMRGSEDLSGGMRAIFQLEAAINPENGSTSAALFNRHAWVGLAAGFGEITLGRQETMHRVMNNGNYNDVATEGELSVTTANSGLQLMQNFGTRVDNAVRYASPTVAGFRVRVQSALGNRVTAATNGLLVTYDNGPFRAALTHEYYDGAGVTGISRWNEVTTLSGQYNAGFATFALGFQSTSKLLASNAANTLTTAAALPDATAYNLGIIYPVTKELSLRGQYTVSTTKFPAVGATAGFSRDYARIGVSARYALSPRTYLYAAYTEKDVDVNTAVAAQVTANATANKNSLGLGISSAF